MKTDKQWDIEVRSAYAAWKRKDKKGYDRFLHWTKYQLKKQQVIDSVECVSYEDDLGYSDLTED